MVTRSVLAAVLALLGALLSGCPDNVGDELHNGVEGLVAPESLSGSATSPAEILLTWEDRATSESGYRVEINDSPFAFAPATGFVILPAGSTSYAYACHPNNSYYFRVFAVTDTKESDPSNEIVVFTPLPTGPSWIIYQSLGTAVLTWEDVSGETGYQMEYSTDAATWTTYGVDVPADTTTAAILTGLVSGQMYYFRVRAITPYGLSAPSPNAIGIAP